MRLRRVLQAASLVAAMVFGSDLAEAASYTVNENRSSVRVHVGKSGVFSFAGHRHEVEVPVSGRITADPASIGASAVELSFPVARFRVLPDDEPAGDVPKVEEVMRGPRVLDASRFPEVQFRSASVEGEPSRGTPGAYDLRIAGDLTVHGVTRRLTVPVTVSVEGGVLTATGHATIRHDQFGLTPVSAGGGTVKVANEIGIDFRIVAQTDAVASVRE